MNVGSDHRLIRGTIKPNPRLERSRMIRSGKPKINIGGLLLKKEEFQLRLQNRFEVLNNEGEDDVEEMVDRITNTIQESALATAGRHRENRRMKSLKVRQKLS